MSNISLPEGVDAETLSGIIPDADLLRLLDEADSAPEPGTKALGLDPKTLRPVDVLHAADEELPVGMAAKIMGSAGYVRVYHTRTGIGSLVNRNMLPAQLRKRLPKEDGPEWHGKLAFTTRKPKAQKKIVLKPCYLHPDRRTAEYDEMGLPECRKQLTSEFQVRRHMQHRHKSSWATIEEIRERTEREETLAIQRQILALAANSATDKDTRTPEQIQAAKDRMAAARAARGKKDE